MASSTIATIAFSMAAATWSIRSSSQSWRAAGLDGGGGKPERVSEAVKVMRVASGEQGPAVAVQRHGQVGGVHAEVGGDLRHAIPCALEQCAQRGVGVGALRQRGVQQGRVVALDG